MRECLSGRKVPELWRRGAVRGPSAARLRRFAQDDDSRGASCDWFSGAGV